MLLETSLFFKTMLILCGQLTVVLGTCFYFIRGARRAYENNTSFAGIHFRGSMNMNKQLDLVPYTAAPEHYPSEMCKKIPSEDNPNKSETKTVMAMNEAHRLDLLKDGYIDSGGGEFFYFAFILSRISCAALLDPGVPSTECWVALRPSSPLTGALGFLSSGRTRFSYGRFYGGLN